MQQDNDPLQAASPARSGSPAQATSYDVQEDEIHLLDYLIVLAKRKRLILQITLGAAIMAAIISLILPPIYKAETWILPPQQGSSSMAAQMMGQLGGVAGLAGSALGISTPSDLYVGLLKSRPVLDNMIDKFQLMNVYKAKYRENARVNLLGALKAQGDKKSGIITIGVEDKDPKRASEMANAFVQELKNLTRGLAVTEAAQRRLFFEEQLKETKVSLIRAEDAIKGFQERTGALKIDDQAKVVIEGIANLRAQIVAKEVQLKVMGTYSTPQNPDLQKVEDELKGLKVGLSGLEAKSGSGYDPLMPTGRMPGVGTEYVRKLRDVKLNEAIYELLAKQYEMAKLDEARDATLIQVIAKAAPPEKKVRPKRAQMVILATITGFFSSIFAVFIMEYKDNAATDPDHRGRIEMFKRYMQFKR